MILLERTVGERSETDGHDGISGGPFRARSGGVRRGGERGGGGEDQGGEEGRHVGSKLEGKEVEGRVCSFIEFALFFFLSFLLFFSKRKKAVPGFEEWERYKVREKEREQVQERASQRTRAKQSNKERRDVKRRGFTEGMQGCV